MNQNLVLGISALTVGLGLMVALDPWFIGIAFIVIGVNRLTAGAQERAAGDNEQP